DRHRSLSRRGIRVAERHAGEAGAVVRRARAEARGAADRAAVTEAGRSHAADHHEVAEREGGVRGRLRVPATRPRVEADVRVVPRIAGHAPGAERALEGVPHRAVAGARGGDDADAEVAHGKEAAGAVDPDAV